MIYTFPIMLFIRQRMLLSFCSHLGLHESYISPTNIKWNWYGPNYISSSVAGSDTSSLYLSSHSLIMAMKADDVFVYLPLRRVAEEGNWRVIPFSFPQNPANILQMACTWQAGTCECDRVQTNTRHRRHLLPLRTLTGREIARTRKREKMASTSSGLV